MSLQCIQEDQAQTSLGDRQLSHGIQVGINTLWIEIYTGIKSLVIFGVNLYIYSVIFSGTIQITQLKKSMKHYRNLVLYPLASWQRHLVLQQILCLRYDWLRKNVTVYGQVSTPMDRNNVMMTKESLLSILDTYCTWKYCCFTAIFHKCFCV